MSLPHACGGVSVSSSFAPDSKRSSPRMWGAQQSPLPHGRGLFLFSIPGSSHWADQFHDERAEAAGRSSHTSKDGQPDRKSTRLNSSH